MNVRVSKRPEPGASHYTRHSINVDGVEIHARLEAYTEDDVERIVEAHRNPVKRPTFSMSMKKKTGPKPRGTQPAPVESDDL